MVRVRKLSTGDVAVFDTAKRELIVVPKKAARGVTNWAAALALVESGLARHLSKAALRGITEALQHIVLLGG